MITFTLESMQIILPILQHYLASKEQISFNVLNPDIYDGYAGSLLKIDNISYRYRSYRAWMDLAELLKCKMLTPYPLNEHLVKLTFKKLSSKSFHSDTKAEEKYGIHSHFSQIHKMEEPAFFHYYNQALHNANVKNKKSILNLGINRGDEFQVIKEQLDTKKYQNMNFVGIDHSKSAIAYAEKLFPEKNVTFYAEDINNLDSLKLGRFDLLISIGTLQSPSINFKPFFMKLVQEHLAKDASIILGFPNSRWQGGEILYGAKAPNYAMPEMSLVLNDIIFCKKYLQQKQYRVTVTGKYYLFLTATKIG